MSSSASTRRLNRKHSSFETILADAEEARAAEPYNYIREENSFSDESHPDNSDSDSDQCRFISFISLVAIVLLCVACYCFYGSGASEAANSKSKSKKGSRNGGSQSGGGGSGGGDGGQGHGTVPGEVVKGSISSKTDAVGPRPGGVGVSAGGVLSDGTPLALNGSDQLLPGGESNNCIPSENTGENKPLGLDGCEDNTNSEEEEEGHLPSQPQSPPLDLKTSFQGWTEILPNGSTDTIGDMSDEIAHSQILSVLGAMGSSTNLSYSCSKDLSNGDDKENEKLVSAHFKQTGMFIEVYDLVKNYTEPDAAIRTRLEEEEEAIAKEKKRLYDVKGNKLRKWYEEMQRLLEKKVGLFNKFCAGKEDRDRRPVRERTAAVKLNEKNGRIATINTTVTPPDSPSDEGRKPDEIELSERYNCDRQNYKLDPPGTIRWSASSVNRKLGIVNKAESDAAHKDKKGWLSNDISSNWKEYVPEEERKVIEEEENRLCLPIMGPELIDEEWLRDHRDLEACRGEFEKFAITPVSVAELKEQCVLLLDAEDQPLKLFSEFYQLTGFTVSPAKSESWAPSATPGIPLPNYHSGGEIEIEEAEQKIPLRQYYSCEADLRYFACVKGATKSRAPLSASLYRQIHHLVKRVKRGDFDNKDNLVEFSLSLKTSPHSLAEKRKAEVRWLQYCFGSHRLEEEEEKAKYSPKEIKKLRVQEAREARDLCDNFFKARDLFKADNRAEFGGRLIGLLCYPEEKDATKRVEMQGKDEKEMEKIYKRKEETVEVATNSYKKWIEEGVRGIGEWKRRGERGERASEESPYPLGEVAKLEEVKKVVFCGPKFALEEYYGISNAKAIDKGPTSCCLALVETDSKKLEMRILFNREYTCTNNNDHKYDLKGGCGHHHTTKSGTISVDVPQEFKVECFGSLRIAEGEKLNSGISSGGFEICGK